MKNWSPLSAAVVILLVTFSVHGLEEKHHHRDPFASLALEEDTFIKRNPGGTSGMWFGPRLGRKRRTIDLEQSGEAPNKEGTLVELLKETPWALIAIQGEKRHKTFNFTPRLGRESQETNEEPIDGRFLRNPPFSPRLGRLIASPFNTNNFTPRLGRIDGLVIHP